jgi:hypothetical protein
VGLRILCCGSRSWADPVVISRVQGPLPPGSTIIHGDQGYEKQPGMWVGADAWCDHIGRHLGFEIVRYPADWDGPLKKKAGPQRNSDMLAEAPDAVVAFRLGGRSPGTDNTIEKARWLGIPVLLVGPDGEEDWL